jgi:hypothetical protein
MNNLGRRLVVWIAWLAPVVALFLMLGDWFDPPHVKIGGATRKCAWAMGANMIKDAEDYCRTAIGLANGPHKIPVLELARAYTQAAALAVSQRRVDESVVHCRKAVAAWKQVKPVFEEREKTESINACETLIAAAAKRKKTF